MKSISPNIFVTILCILALLPACKSQQPTQRPATSQAAEIDSSRYTMEPSAERLHDLSGALMLYFLANNHLPPTLQALADEPSINCPPIVSPRDNQPFVYVNPPLALKGRPGSLLIYEATPSPAASSEFNRPVYWAVLIDRDDPNAPLTSQVIFLSRAEIESAQRNAAPSSIR